MVKKIFPVGKAEDITVIGDDNHDRTGFEPAENTEHQIVAVFVQAAIGVVKKDDPWFVCQNPGYGDALFEAGRNGIGYVIGELGFIPFRQDGDGIVNTEEPGHDHGILFIGGVEEGQVFPDGSVENSSFLR